MRDYLLYLSTLFSRVSNPQHVVFDKLGIRKQPYVVKMRDGIKVELRPGMGDSYGFYEIMLRGDYTDFGQVIKPGDTVIDVGANIGCFSLLASSLVGPAGRVISLEPELATFEQLQKNIALNGLQNITAHRLALSDKVGELKLHYGSNSLFSSIFDSVDGRESEQRTQVVPTMTLRDLMKSENVNRCNYLKLDCEGAEYQILGSIDEALGADIDQVVIEIHAVPGHETCEIDALLDPLGFYLVDSRSVHYYRRQL